MREFVELQGASGASYRFRHWPPSNVHLPIAGNYVVIRETADGVAVIAAEVSDDLSLVRASLTRSIRDQPGLEIYTRLNVSRAVRMMENDDIVAATKPQRVAQVASDEG